MYSKNGRENRASRRRKRVFKGNQHTKKDPPVCSLTEQETTTEAAAEASGNIVVEKEEVTTSLSAKKLKLPSDSIVVNNDVVESKECNIIINSSLLINFFGKLCKCPNCGSHLKIIHDISEKKGLSHEITTV